MKFELYCSCLQSDGRQLRFIRRFDSLLDCANFIRDYRKLLQRDWKVVQVHTHTTDREKIQLYDFQEDSKQQDLPF